MKQKNKKNMRLEAYIRSRLEQKQILLMTHAVVGYPSLDENWAMLECMQDAGIDLVELQLPFSEPIADGPAFIRANQSALQQDVRWEDYFNFLKKAYGAFDFPILFMGYYNSVFCMGHDSFCERLKNAGGSGYIIADLPLEESGALDAAGRQQGLDHVQIMTPVNSDERMKQIADHASGFLYCVARKGVTGKATAFDDTLSAYLQRCRNVTDLPLALGFGLKASEQIADLKGLSDIAIVGTACLEVWQQRGRTGLLEFLKHLAANCH